MDPAQRKGCDPTLPPERREAAYHQLCRELFRPSRIARRLTGIPWRGFPGVHGLSLMSQLPMRRALGKAREAWSRANQHVALALP